MPAELAPRLNPCPGCGYDEGTKYDGYPPADVVRDLLEECPPPVLIAFVAMLREYKAKKQTGSGALRFDGKDGQPLEWEVDPPTQKFRAGRKKAG